MLKRFLCGGLFVFAVLSSSCGGRRMTTIEEDSGVDAGVVDAGRPRGDDPAMGWQTIFATPDDAGVSTRWGASVASTVDQFGQPLIAAVIDDPNGDAVRTDTRVVFSRWNGTKKAFEPLQTIETVGAIKLEVPHRQVSVSFDKTTDRIAIAYMKDVNSVRVAVSDDEGANFSLFNGSLSGLTSASDPQVIAANGLIHVAYVADNVITYRRFSGLTAQAENDVPLPNTAFSVAGPISLAIDANGALGLAYVYEVAGGAGGVAYWKAGASMSTSIVESGLVLVNTADRRPSVTLTFNGTKPVVAYHLLKEELTTALDSPELFYATASVDDGTVWNAPVGMPRNNNTTTFSSTRFFQSVVVESGASARISVVGNYAAGGFTMAQCGGPKLARSSDGANFTTCAPTDSPFSFAGTWLSASEYKAGKLQVVFFYESRNHSQMKSGIVMWREL